MGIPCTDLAPHPWAEQTLQTIYGIIGTGSGARVVATEMGDNNPVDPAWKTEWAMESLTTLMEKYQIEGGSFWRWTSFMDSEDSDPTLTQPVKVRGVNFVYNPVQKEILDWAGFHLTAIPNGSFEDDVAANGVPTQWTQTGSGTAAAYFLAAGAGPAAGSFARFLLPAPDDRSRHLLQGQCSKTGFQCNSRNSYTTAANLRFSWTGDPNPSGNSAKRPQVFVSHSLPQGEQTGPAATTPSTVFLPTFRRTDSPGFSNLRFSVHAPERRNITGNRNRAARNSLSMPIVFDADNFR